jgi:hypothetical protein
MVYEKESLFNKILSVHAGLCYMGGQVINFHVWWRPGGAWRFDAEEEAWK